MKLIDYFDIQDLTGSQGLVTLIHTSYAPNDAGGCVEGQKFIVRECDTMPPDELEAKLWAAIELQVVKFSSFVDGREEMGADIDPKLRRECLDRIIGQHIAKTTRRGLSKRIPGTPLHVYKGNSPYDQPFVLYRRIGTENIGIKMLTQGICAWSDYFVWDDLERSDEG